jgi:hypothetical protein
MKNGGYEYENFRHFFGFPILKLVNPKFLDFIFFYRLECMHGPKIVKKNNNENYFFFYKILSLYTIRLKIDCSFRIYEYICTCMHIEKKH